MPMQPRPIADTDGPFLPKYRVSMTSPYSVADIGSMNTRSRRIP
jgi:hypothetical protein